MKVLIVEDNEQLQRMYVRFFKREGMEVSAFSHAEHALKAVEDGLLPEIVISDNDLEGDMRGEELTGILAGKLVGARILLVSGRPQDSLHIKPGVQFIGKPIDLRHLMKEIKNV